MTNDKRPLSVIRSFVKREGRMTHAQERALEVLWPEYGLDIADSPLILSSLFDNPGPCLIEIGFGMGGSLLQMCQARPETHFIGIDVHRPGVGALLKGAGELALKNLKVFCADAKDVLYQAIPPQGLDGILIYFPDPWPKKRHHKRRLIQSDFVILLASRLKADGYVHFATDWQDYAEHVEAVFAESGLFLPPELSTGDRPTTKYERRGMRLGHQVKDLIFYKCKNT